MAQSFDYGASAEVFTAMRMSSKPQPVRYRRFDAAAEAVRYVMEELPKERLAGTVLECDEERYEGVAIRELYDSPQYPLNRSPRI